MNFDFSKVIGNTNIAIDNKKEIDNSLSDVSVSCDLYEEEIVETPIEKQKVQKKSTKQKAIKIEDEIKELKRITDVITIIKKELNDCYLERENEIDLLTLAFVSGSNAFLLGKPGTAKSDLAEEYSSRIESSYFRILMSKTTEPAEIFGPVSIQSLKQDIYKVKTDNKLPSCNIGFLDEIFKANSAVLNGLLTIMNEKLFFNDTVEEVPLVSAIGASNEMPQESSLEALFDRFLLRWNVESIKDNNNLEIMFKNYIQKRNDSTKISSSNVSNIPKVKTTISYDDLNTLSELSKKVIIKDNIIKEYLKLLTKLQKEGIHISDRRKNECLKILQASATINNRMEVQLEDFSSLIYCLWIEIEDIEPISKEILKIANPIKEFINDYTNSLNEYIKDYEAFVSENSSSVSFEIDNASKIIGLREPLIFAIQKIDDKLQVATAETVKVKLKNLYTAYEDFLNDITSKLINYKIEKE